MHIGAIAPYTVGGAPAVGVTFLTASSEVFVSIDGGALTAAANNATEISSTGCFDYPASEAEAAAAKSYIFVLLKKADGTQGSITKDMESSFDITSFVDAALAELFGLVFIGSASGTGTAITFTGTIYGSGVVAANVLRDGIIHVIQGTGAGQFATIESNTATGHGPETGAAVLRGSGFAAALDGDNTVVIVRANHVSADTNVTSVNGDPINDLIDGRIDATIGAVEAGAVTPTAFSDAALAELFGIVAYGSISGTGTGLTAGSWTVPNSGAIAADTLQDGVLHVIQGDGAGQFATIISNTEDGATIALRGNGIAATLDGDNLVVIVRADRQNLTTLTNASIAAQVWAQVLEDSNQAGDMFRAMLSILLGVVSGFDTGTLPFKSTNGVKTRQTVVTAPTGRTSSTKGDWTP